ncbi:hypothetical protein C8R44DRAFT_785583, partial [Mycena epipterygia]
DGIIRRVSRTSTRAGHPRTQSSRRAQLSYHWKTSSIPPSPPRARLPGRQSHRLLAHTARTLEHLKNILPRRYVSSCPSLQFPHLSHSPLPSSFILMICVTPSFYAHGHNDRPTATFGFSVLPALQSLELNIRFGSDRTFSPGVCLTVAAFSATAPHIHTLTFVMFIDTTLVYMRHAECSLMSCFYLVSITLQTRAGSYERDMEGHTGTILKCGLLVIYMGGIVLGAAGLGR